MTPPPGSTPPRVFNSIHTYNPIACALPHSVYAPVRVYNPTACLCPRRVGIAHDVYITNRVWKQTQPVTQQPTPNPCRAVHICNHHSQSGHVHINSVYVAFPQHGACVYNVGITRSMHMPHRPDPPPHGTCTPPTP